MTDNEVMVTCPCCGNRFPKGAKFCPECGTKYEENYTGYTIEKKNEDDAENIFKNDLGVPFRNPFVSSDSEEPEIFQTKVSDEGLTLLADYCRKTLATVGGDGYSEAVLYVDEKTGTYSVHTYSKYVYMKREEHHAFKADEAFKNEVFRLIDELKLIDLKDQRGFGLCGGDFILKFVHEGQIVRLSSQNTSDFSGICAVGNLLYSVTSKENELFE